jgi:hypothetical protein
VLLCGRATRRARLLAIVGKRGPSFDKLRTRLQLSASHATNPVLSLSKHGWCARPVLQAMRALVGPRQRLENWKLRRAFMRPYFLRSTTRLSRVRKPPFLSTGRSSGSK